MKRKFYSWEECMNLREVKVSSQHELLPHIFIAEQRKWGKSQNKRLYFIML